MRMLGSRIISGAIKLTTGGKNIEDVTSGMRLFNKRMIKILDITCIIVRNQIRLLIC